MTDCNNRSVWFHDVDIAESQQAFASQGQEDDLLSTADLLQSPRSTGYYYNYEQEDNFLESTLPPIVGPSSYYEYSQEFTDGQKDCQSIVYLLFLHHLKQQIKSNIKKKKKVIKWKNCIVDVVKDIKLLHI